MSNTKTNKPCGYVIYDGPSMIDGTWHDADHVALLEILADMREEHDERHKQVMDAVK